jgi:hypothetical protein
MISSFEKKPEKGKTPHRARVDTVYAAKVTGM